LISSYWQRNPSTQAWEESQNHRMVEVGGDLCRSYCSPLLLKQGHLKLVALDRVWNMDMEHVHIQSKCIVVLFL